MSSTTAASLTASISTTSTSATSTASTTDSSDGMPKSANYFLAFLITFVGLLLVFVGFGFASRRRFQRIGLANAWDTASLDGDRVFGDKPMMWEVWVRDSEGKEAVWADMQKPISASFICPPSPKPSTDVFESQRIENQNIDVPPTSLTPTSASRPSMFRTIFPGLRESTAPSSTPSKSELASPPQAPPPSAVQVAFMIAMPSEDRRLRSRDSMGSKEPATEGFPGGYELGVAKVPWTHGEL